MPKKTFYGHLAMTTAIKEEFVRLIERIEIIAALKESSARIPAGEKVAEVDCARALSAPGERWRVRGTLWCHRPHCEERAQ